MNDLKTRQPGKKPARLRVHQLAHDICTICRRNSEGAHRTQVERKRTLLLCAAQLFEHNVRCKRVVNLTGCDINLLVNNWLDNELSTATICNRLGHLRWLARKIGKPQIVRSNRDYFFAWCVSCVL